MNTHVLIAMSATLNQVSLNRIVFALRFQSVDLVGRSNNPDMFLFDVDPGVVIEHRLVKQLMI